jgi:hypothetical protein
MIKKMKLKRELITAKSEKKITECQTRMENHPEDGHMTAL